MHICLCFSGNKLWSHLDATVMASRTKHNVTADATVEVQRYLSEPNIGRTDDPLLYWERQKCIYPNRYKLAIVYLCTQPHLFPVRVFSKAGEVISKKRNRLNPSTVEKILFLNKPMKKIQLHIFNVHKHNHLQIIFIHKHHSLPC